MSISRSIETRLAEAVWTALAADTDLSTLCNGRIYIGPWVRDPNFIEPPQINVRAVPSGDEIGISGTSTVNYRIEVAYFEPRSQTRNTIAAGATNTGPDVMAWIERVLIIGKGTAGSDVSQQGYLLDPDDGTTTLNQALVSFQRAEPIPTPNNAALAWPIFIDYTVRQNKLRQLT